MRLFLRSLAISQKVKHSVTIYLSNFTPTFKFQRIENICSQENLYMNVHSSIIYISQKVETTQMSISWFTDKQNLLYPCSEIVFSHRKESSIDTCYNMAEPWKHHAKIKKNQTHKNVLYDSISIVFGRGKLIETKSSLVVAKDRRRECKVAVSGNGFSHWAGESALKLGRGHTTLWMY